MGVVVDRLSEDRDNLIKSNDSIPDHRKRVTEDIATFGPPAEATTNNTLVNINAGNSLKNDIIVIGGNVGLGSVRYGSSTSNITSQYGSIVAGVGTTTGNFTSITGIGTTQVVAFGRVNSDLAKIYDYPNLTNYNSDLVLDGEGFVTLTASNVGQGVSTRVYQSTGSQLGLVYDIIGPAVDVTSLISQYNDVWNKSQGYADVATRAQELIGDARFADWGLYRQEAKNNAEIVNLNTSIGIASDTTYGGPW